MKIWSLKSAKPHCFVAVLLLAAMINALNGPAIAQYADWKQSGSLFILTTPDGADLPAVASIEGFPLLIRLTKETFDFATAQSHGEDLRFATSDGMAVPYQIEEWDPAGGKPLIERDHYGRKDTESITAPNLQQAYYTSPAKDALTLEFDQPVVWTDTLAGQFYLNGEKDKVVSGSLNGNVLTLKLKEASVAKHITYLKEKSWSQEKLMVGKNGISALTFCEVPIGVK